AAHIGARRATTTGHPAQVLLEERQVAARHRAHSRRPARLLGAVRVPQRRRSVRGGALRLLMPIEGFLDSPRKGDETSARSDDNLGNPILPSSSPSEW